MQSRVSTSFISRHLTQVVQPKLSSSPLQEKKSLHNGKKITNHTHDFSNVPNNEYGYRAMRGQYVDGGGW